MFLLTKRHLCRRYGLENIVDIISSVLVLWRFAQEGKGDADPFKAQRCALFYRFTLLRCYIVALFQLFFSSISLETRGSVGIAMCFVALSIFIFCSAGPHPQLFPFDFSSDLAWPYFAMCATDLAHLPLFSPTRTFISVLFASHARCLPCIRSRAGHRTHDRTR